ncbi:HNH endonuclease [Yoonia sp. 2307UL14-13]|uniref:HNH endonuclease n=1 Tax=Yoonia sp. 2307UL14-13 TaxID=3126506 RepID=UPI0030A001B6
MARVEYKNGFPDFSGVSEGSVEIPMRGNRLENPETGDFGLAEKAYIDKYGSLPDGYDRKEFTWHHKEDGVTMELVPEEIHAANRHTGGGVSF